jgi:hypothetical protein
MKIKTNVQAGGLRSVNHNPTRGLRVKTGIKSGGMNAINHNQN